MFSKGGYFKTYIAFNGPLDLNCCLLYFRLTERVNGGYGSMISLVGLV